MSGRRPPKPKTPRGIEARLRRAADGSWTWHFRVRWIDPGTGRRAVEEFDTLEEARDFQAQLRLARRRRVLPDLDRGSERLTDFIDEWWERYAKANLAKSTRKGYATLWNRHGLGRIGHLELRRVTPGVIARLRHDLEEDGVGRESIRKLMAMLQAVFREAIVWERLPTNAGNPVQPVRKPRSKRKLAIVALAPVAIERLRRTLLGGYWVDGANGTRVWREPDVRSATLVSLLAYEGLRPEEALALEVRHIGEATLLIEQKNVDGEIVPGQKTNKPPRSPELFGPVRDDIAEYIPVLDGQPSANGRARLLFARTGGEPWTETDYRNWRARVFQPAAAAAGLAQLDRVVTYSEVEGKRRRRVRSRYAGPRPYDLRHSAASLLLRDPNYSLPEVAAFLGHDVATLSQHYAHVIAELKGKRSEPVARAIRAARQRTG